MKASGNGAPEICVQNLLKTIRGEVPYERIKGIDRTLIDKPSETAATDLAADVEFLVETYEPRVQLSDSDLKALTAQAGDFELRASINIGALVVLLGIPTAATGFCFWMLEHRIQKREKQKEAEEAKRQKEAAARERAREDLQIITIQGTSAAIALGEATARAVQRIPDAHCNGDMHAALDYAAKIKHAQKDFLTSQGIHAIID